MEHRLASYQTVVTAVIANRARLDGIEVLVQQPNRQEEEMAYVHETGRGCIEHAGKHWVSELEGSRHIQWQGQWQRGDAVAQELRQAHPESFRAVRVRCRHGETKPFWVFTKVVRLKRYGRKRLVVVHEQEDLGDA